MEDTVDKAIIDLFAALKELGELRRRYDNVIGNVNVYLMTNFRISPFINNIIVIFVGLSAFGQDSLFHGSWQC